MFSKRVENTILYAAKAHAWQKDKAGAPYILHPLRVGLTFSLLPHAESEIIVGVLHDVVEDTDAILSDVSVELDLTDAETAAIDAISKRVNEDYPTYLARVAANRLAREVKYEDLRDNVGRTVGATYIEESHKLRMLRKYVTALAYFGVNTRELGELSEVDKEVLDDIAKKQSEPEKAAKIEDIVNTLSYTSLLRIVCRIYPDTFSMADEGV